MPPIPSHRIASHRLPSPSHPIPSHPITTTCRTQARTHLDFVGEDNSRNHFSQPPAVRQVDGDAQRHLVPMLCLHRAVLRNTATKPRPWYDLRGLDRRKSAKEAHEVRGRVVGIVGYGRIGSQVGLRPGPVYPSPPAVVHPSVQCTLPRWASWLRCSG